MFLEPGVSKETALFNAPGDRQHAIYQYSGDVYKIIQYYGFRQHFGPGPRENFSHSGEKLDSSYSRARSMLLELALCNQWDYFVTFTLSPEKVDRFDLDGWHKKFKEFLKYQKKAHGLNVRYLLVPEKHDDGAWHAHGLFSGNMELISFRDLDAAGYRSDNGRRLKKKLRESDYLNWPLFQKTFGFCSLGHIRSPVGSALYVSKYITKDLARSVSQCGKHLYWASRPLCRKNKVGQFFARDRQYLDTLLRNRYEFCATGLVLPQEGWDSHLVGDMIEALGGTFGSGRPFVPLDLSPGVVPADSEMEVDSWHDFEQLNFRL